jgi:hypothetical protein
MTRPHIREKRPPDRAKPGRFSWDAFSRQVQCRLRTRSIECDAHRRQCQTHPPSMQLNPWQQTRVSRQAAPCGTQLHVHASPGRQGFPPTFIQMVLPQHPPVVASQVLPGARQHPPRPAQMSPAQQCASSMQLLVLSASPQVHLPATGSQLFVQHWTEAVHGSPTLPQHAKVETGPLAPETRQNPLQQPGSRPFPEQTPPSSAQHSPATQRSPIGQCPLCSQESGGRPVQCPLRQVWPRQQSAAVVQVPPGWHTGAAARTDSLSFRLRRLRSARPRRLASAPIPALASTPPTRPLRTRRRDRLALTRLVIASKSWGSMAIPPAVVMQMRGTPQVRRFPHGPHLLPAIVHCWSVAMPASCRDPWLASDACDGRDDSKGIASNSVSSHESRPGGCASRAEPLAGVRSPSPLWCSFA